MLSFNDSLTDIIEDAVRALSAPTGSASSSSVLGVWVPGLKAGSDTAQLGNLGPGAVKSCVRRLHSDLLTSGSCWSYGVAMSILYLTAPGLLT